MKYIYKNAARGDAPAVIKAIDRFGQYYPM